LLDANHQAMKDWDPIALAQGRHELQLPLAALSDGEFYFEVRTTTQRTIRGFRLQQA
jgi:hypothetical protein